MDSPDKLGDMWLFWYWGKENEIDPEIPRIADQFARNNVTAVLDLGCGTGRHSIFLAKKGFNVSAFDQSENAIKRAKDLAEKERLELNLRVWDMIDFPYPYQDSSFSAVISTRVIHHTTKDNIEKIAAEISRITKQNGYLFLEVPTIDKLKRLKSENAGQNCKEIEDGSVIFLGGEEKNVIHHYFTEEELLSMFDDYRVLDLHVKDEHYCFTALKI